MPTEFLELNSHISQFKTLITSCRYAGELCLDEEQIVSFSTAIRRYESRLNREDYEISILVLAVNIAYYFYDDDGFWCHFNRITGTDNTEMVGKTIERALRRYGLLNIQRFGPFRYVGAVLEQCGISKKYIPTFTYILKELKRAYRGDRILDLNYSDIIHFLRDFSCSKYLKDFLLDEEGATFTLQVLRNIKMYEDGVINDDELRSLEGYRPDFWKEILKHFRIIPNEKKSNVLFIKPTIRLNLTDRVMELVFPSRTFWEGMEKRDLFSFPVTKLSSHLELQEKFCGKAQGEDGQILYWEIPGWIPQGEPVLFHGNRRTMIPKHHVILPGMYYLVAPTIYLIPENFEATFLGELNMVLGESYYLYKLNLNYGDKLPHLKIATKADTVGVSLLFKDSERFLFPYSIEPIDVFVGNIPELEISDFGPIHNNTVGLFYDFGKIKGRIRNQDDLLQLRYSIEKNLPVKGKIWSEVIVRSSSERFQGISSELLFYVIPPINIMGNERYYGFGINPKLHIKKSTNLNLVIQGASINGEQYQFAANTKKVEGHINLDGDFIEFQIPLIRAGILNENGHVTRFLEISELKNSRYIFNGPPESEVRLRILDDHITFNLDNKGTAIIKGELLLPANNSKLSVYPLEAQIGLEKFSLGCWLINSDVIFSQFDMPGIVQVKGMLGNLLGLIPRISKGPLQQKVHFRGKLPVVSKKFNSKLSELLACAQVFDETIFVVEDEDADWVTTLENVHLRTILEAYRKREWHEALINHEELIPRVSRWNSELETYIKTAAPQNHIEVTGEWSLEVNAHRMVGLRSTIGRLQFGQDLTQAWINYQKAKVPDALSRLSSISDECQDIIMFLREFLKVVIYIRQARFRQAKSLIDTMSKIPENASDIQYLLRTLVYILNGEMHLANLAEWSKDKAVAYLEILPLSKLDNLLLRELCSYLFSGNICLVSDLGEDWLHSWLKLCLMEIEDRLSPEFVLSLNQLISTIPPSAEKSVMIDKINRLVQRG